MRFTLVCTSSLQSSLRAHITRGRYRRRQGYSGMDDGGFRPVLFRFTLWGNPVLVRRCGAVVGCVRRVISSVEGTVTGLAISGLGLAVRRGHRSVLVYIHPQFIPKSGSSNNRVIDWSAQYEESMQYLCCIL